MAFDNILYETTLLRYSMILQVDSCSESGFHSVLDNVNNIFRV